MPLLATTKTPVAPINEVEIRKAFQTLQSKDAAGNPITEDVLGAFVSYTALQFAGQDMFANNGSAVDAMANQILGYLQPYSGSNKRVALHLFGYSVFVGDFVGGQGVALGYQQGALPGIGQSWAIACFALWD